MLKASRSKWLVQEKKKVNSSALSKKIYIYWINRLFFASATLCSAELGEYEKWTQTQFKVVIDDSQPLGQISQTALGTEKATERLFRNVCKLTL